MRKHFKNYRKAYTVLGILIIILLGYFFYPLTFKVMKGDQVYIHISKEIEGKSYTYDLNDQEISDFVNILEKSKFYRGVSKPEHMFAGKSLDIRVIGGLGPLITIYYDTDKTYIFANISTGPFYNVYYRISNKADIRKFTENLVNSKSKEFIQVPIQ